MRKSGHTFRRFSHISHAYRHKVLPVFVDIDKALMLGWQQAETRWTDDGHRRSVTVLWLTWWVTSTNNSRWYTTIWLCGVGFIYKTKRKRWKLEWWIMITTSTVLQGGDNPTRGDDPTRGDNPSSGRHVSESNAILNSYLL